MEIVTLQQARETGSKKYFTGEPCSRGHVSFRRTDTRACWECYKLNLQEWRLRNKSLVRAIDKKSRETRGDGRLAKKRAESKADYNKRPELYAEKCKARRAGIGERTPTWADRKAIRAFYREAIRLTRETGIVHEVDHIHPLRGRNFSGLHVEYNLRVVPQRVNRRKSNKLEAA